MRVTPEMVGQIVVNEGFNEPIIVTAVGEEMFLGKTDPDGPEVMCSREGHWKEVKLLSLEIFE